jgi:hypothetical protein
MTRASKNLARPQVEQLEGRELLSGVGGITFNPTTGAVTIAGTQYNEHVSLFSATVNGVKSVIISECSVSSSYQLMGSWGLVKPLSKVSSVTFYGGGGVDYFNNMTSVTTYAYAQNDQYAVFFGGSGSDTFYAGTGTSVFGAGKGHETFHTGSGHHIFFGNYTLN